MFIVVFQTQEDKTSRALSSESGVVKRVPGDQAGSVRVIAHAVRFAFVPSTASLCGNKTLSTRYKKNKKK